jgi:acyl carrier protein phosphodiesterase
MNYLGHIFLSGENNQVRIGNFIGDFVKGSKFKSYPIDVQRGILLHREIDRFTDSNKNVSEITTFFKPLYKRYAGIISDMIIDHILAKNWGKYSDITLNRFATKFYMLLLANYRILPRKVQYITPFMIQSNRLYSYSTEKGIIEAISIMERHTSLPEKSQYLPALLNENYNDIQELSIRFISEVSEHVNQILNNSST